LDEIGMNGFLCERRRDTRRHGLTKPGRVMRRTMTMKLNG
jgi:hypothetical protein